MSIFSKLMSSIRGGGKPKSTVEPVESMASSRTLPTVKFDPKLVTETVKIDVENNIRALKDFDEGHYQQVYEAALRSISKGRDLAGLVVAILELNLPGMTKQRASEISQSLHNKATALINRDKQLALGIKYAVWMCSDAPCQVNPKKPSAKDIRQNAAHKAANGKQYEVTKGMLLNGRYRTPGWDDGCKCSSQSIIPGLDCS